MNENVEKVLEQTQPTVCTVLMDGKETSSDDFVAILSRESGDASIFYNTDALTLGMAMKMVARAFVDSMQQLPEEEQATVQKILGSAFCVEGSVE